jgi:ribosomal protein S7
MLKSDAERILRRTMEETKMQLTEQQIQCLSQAMLKIAQQVVEEALSLYNPKTGR